MHGYARPSIAPAGWQAALELRFARREQQTRLIRKLHRGPLQVQKVLYPEGRDTCHAAILHPPGGIAAGDELKIDVGLDADAHALLTSPGATKWYRSEGVFASQTLSFKISAAGVLEWLPRENIFFDGSNIAMDLDVDLVAGAGYFGWDIFSSVDALRVRAGAAQTADANLHSPRRPDDLDGKGACRRDERFHAVGAGLAGRSVCGTFVVAGYEIAAPLLVACREIKPKLLAPAAGGGTRAAVTHYRACCSRDIWEIRPRRYSNGSYGCGACCVPSWRAKQRRRRGCGHARTSAPVELTPREKDKLLIFTASLVAERRRARGVKLNYPEAVALITAAILEGARDGKTWPN